LPVASCQKVVWERKGRPFIMRQPQRDAPLLFFLTTDY